jgi:hypothetical protein
VGYKNTGEKPTGSKQPIGSSCLRRRFQMNINKEIEKVAYELYEKGGCIPGRELEHWFEAEKIVHGRYAVSFDEKQPKTKKSSTSKPSTKKVAAKESKTTTRS